MFDYDAIIIGGGPAGLTSGLYLSQANYQTLLIEKETFGGTIVNVDCVENYPGFSEGVSGAVLASEMITQATKYGLEVKQAEVTGIELFSKCSLIKFGDGTSNTCGVVIVAGGARRKKLNVSNEEALQGKGVFNCALCDGGKFVDRVVAVCGGGDAGLTEALYLTKLASKVIVLEMLPALSATAVLQQRASCNPKLEIYCGVEVQAILGDSRVEGIVYFESRTGLRRSLQVDGVLVYVGLEPNTSYIEGIVPLSSRGEVIVNQGMETEIPYILAAGDVRCGSPRQISTAIGDGAIAAISARRLLQELA
jgi:thioredoxin reductase (NADPH)